MKTSILNIRRIPPVKWPSFSSIQAAGLEILLAGLLLTWYIGPVWPAHQNTTAGAIEDGTSMLVVLGLIVFLLIVGLSWWLLNRFWTMQGMPSTKQMVSQFNTLELWQQLSFYWLSFALLLLAAIICIGSIV